MKQTILIWLEQWLPLTVSVIVFFMSIYIDFTFTIEAQSFINCNTAIMTSISIVIGFVGVLIGIISTLRETKEFKNFLAYKDGKIANKLKQYFIQIIVCGSITLIISPTLFFLELYNQISYMIHINIIHMLVPLFFSLVTYSIFSTGRLFLFIIGVLFFDFQSISDNEVKEDDITMTIEEKNAFRKKHSE